MAGDVFAASFEGAADSESFVVEFFDLVFEGFERAVEAFVELGDYREFFVFVLSDDFGAAVEEGVEAPGVEEVKFVLFDRGGGGEKGMEVGVHQEV